MKFQRKQITILSRENQRKEADHLQALQCIFFGQVRFFLLEIVSKKDVTRVSLLLFNNFLKG